MVARGELWWADLGAPRGSSPAWRRPVLIVSADAFNRSRIQTVTAVAVTSNVRLARAPGNVLLAAGAGGLDRDSVANVTQVVTVDRRVLGARIGALTRGLMNAVDDGLRLALRL